VTVAQMPEERALQMLRIRDEQREEIAQNLGMTVEGLVVRVEEASQPATKPNYGMLYVREEQDSAMANDMMERFVSKTLLLLGDSAPAWCEDKSTGERERFVKSIIEFARSRNIFKEINIQKLLIWHVEYGYAIPLSNYLESVLNRKDFYEDYRMEQFFKVITTSTELVEISLGDAS
jgi:hypothetical protein